jgi:hypothetical protein
MPYSSPKQLCFPGVSHLVRMVKDMHQLPDNTTKAVHKTLILAFQFGHGLLVLHRYIPWLLEEAPTHFPSLPGQG